MNDETGRDADQGPERPDPDPAAAGPGAQPPPGPTGLLIIDKRPGFTSMDVCAIVRGKLRRAGAPKSVKVGHGGTLDPMATGVLVVLIGRATRLCDVVMAGEKAYHATIDLAHTSTTDDAEGALTPVEPARRPTLAECEAASTRFVGAIMQRPPNFSALNIGGRRAYDIARGGGVVDLPPRPVTVHTLTITAYAWPTLSITMTCGKGTYVRSLARDLGSALGCGGMLTALRRTAVGRFPIDAARTLDELPDPLTQAGLLPIPPEFAPPTPPDRP